MKKIINGKSYNTETAEFLCEITDRCSNHNKQIETLYKKKTGEFFIFHDKHTTYGNIYHYYSIEPINLEKAKSWVEKHTNENYENIFGEVEE